MLPRLHRSPRRDTSTLWAVFLLPLFFTGGPPSRVSAETVTVAAAADLTYCIEELDRALSAVSSRYRTEGFDRFKRKF